MPSTSNPFKAILNARGFYESETGRFLSPDAKYNDYGISVEVTKEHATATTKGGQTRYFAKNAADMEKFKLEVM